jgi:putative ABC transport system permease protein
MNPSTRMPGWLFRRFVVRRALQNPVRLLLLVCAIAISSTLISSVLRVSLAGVRAFGESLGYSAHDLPLIVSPRGGRFSVSEFGRCLSALRGGFSVVAYRREVGELVTSSGPQAVSVVGITGVTDNEASGQGTGDMTLSDRGARRLGVRAGDEIDLRVNGVRLHGTVSTGTTPGLSDEGVLVPLSWLSRGDDGVLADAVLLRPEGGEPLDEYQRALNAFLPSCAALSVPLQVDTVASRLARGETLVAAYRLNVMIMAGMTLLVCALLVSQATQLSLRTISRELSVLQTLGVGKVACFVGILQEATLMGGIGAFIGVTLGEPLTVRLTELFLQTAHDIYNLDLSGGDSAFIAQRVVVVVGMMFLAAGGSALGAVEALRVAPSVGTRSEYLHVKPISSRWAHPVALVSIALFVLAYGAASWTSSTVAAYLFVAASMVVVAGCTPSVLVIVPRGLRWARGSVLMWFARGGIEVGGRGFLLGAIGAGLSMTLICSLSLLVGSFRSTLERWTVQRLQGDLFVSAALEGSGNDTRLSPLIESQAREISGVLRVIPYYETMTTDEGQVLVVSASDLAAQLERGIYIVRRGTLERTPLVSGTSALVSESAARKLHLSVGDTLTVEGRKVLVGAIIQEFGTEHPLVQIDQGLFLDLYPRQQPKNLTIDLEPGAQISSVKGELERVVGVVGTVRDNRELREYALTLFDRTFRITLSIRWIVFSIALLGLVLASLQNLWERRREIKTMHLLGFSPVQIVGAHVVESAVVCALPVAIGLVGGVALGWGLTAFVNPRSFGWSIDFSLSVTPVVIAVGFIVAVAVVTLAATRVVLKRTIEEATLSDE